MRPLKLIVAQQPSATDGVVAISASQMACMLEGIDWRNPQATWRPNAVG